MIDGDIIIVLESTVFHSDDKTIGNLKNRRINTAMVEKFT
jgi:hypothetical protein